jgi:hypothetical protein
MKDLVKAVALFGIAILTLVAVSSEDVFAQPDRSKGSQNDRSRKARIERAERSINSPKASSRIGRLQWGRPPTPSARAKRTERSRQSQSVRNLRRAKPQRQSHVRKSQPRKRNARAQRRQAFPDLRHWAQRLPRQPRGGYRNNLRLPGYPGPDIRYRRWAYPPVLPEEIWRLQRRLGRGGFWGLPGLPEIAKIRRRHLPAPIPRIVQTPVYCGPPILQDLLCHIGAKKRKLARILMGVQTVIGALSGLGCPPGAPPGASCAPVPPGPWYPPPHPFAP